MATDACVQVFWKVSRRSGERFLTKTIILKDKYQIFDQPLQNTGQLVHWVNNMVLQFCTEQKQIDFEWNYGGHNNKKYLLRVKGSFLYDVVTRILLQSMTKMKKL